MSIHNNTFLTYSYHILPLATKIDESAISSLYPIETNTPAERIYIQGKFRAARIAQVVNNSDIENETL